LLEFSTKLVTTSVKIEKVVSNAIFWLFAFLFRQTIDGKCIAVMNAEIQEKNSTIIVVTDPQERTKEYSNLPKGLVVFGQFCFLDLLFFGPEKLFAVFSHDWLRRLDNQPPVCASCVISILNQPNVATRLVMQPNICP
jgi:hypothetical protein